MQFISVSQFLPGDISFQYPTDENTYQQSAYRQQDDSWEVIAGIEYGFPKNAYMAPWTDRKRADSA